jgi:hypothetical protein
LFFVFFFFLFLNLLFQRELMREALLPYSFSVRPERIALLFLLN